MKLLSAEQIKTEKDKSQTERQYRIKKLNDQETEANKSLSLTQSRVETETKRLNDDLALHEEKTAARKKELIEEVSTLESRRTAALRPIKEIEDLANARLEAVIIREHDADERENRISETQSILSERAEKLTDHESALGDRNKDLNQREIRLSGEEKRSKESGEKLGQKWIEFHKAVAEANASLALREKEIVDGKKANESVQSVFDQTRKDLALQKAHLDDRAETLTRGFQELRIKQQKHG